MRFRPHSRSSDSENGLEASGVTRTQFLRRAAITTIGSRVVSTVVLLGVTPLLARELGVETYGVLVTLTSAATVLGIADFGIANGLISKIASVGWESPRTRELLSAARLVLILASLLTVVVAVMLTLILPWPRWLNAPSIEEAELRWATLFALLGAALSLTTNLGQKVDLARQRGHAVAMWSTLAVLSGPAGALAVAILSPSLPLVVAAAALLPPLVLAGQTTLAIRSLPGYLRPALRLATRGDAAESLRSGGPFLGIGIAIALSFQLDSLIVSGVLGAAAAAQFSVVIRLFGLVGTTIQTSLTQLWSAFAEALSAGDVSWVKRMLVRTTVGAGGGVLIASTGLVYTGNWFIGIWLGSAFKPSTSLLVAAAAWTTYSAAIHPMVMFLNGAGLQRALLVAAVPMAVVNVGLSLYLTHRVGVAGPLIGSLLAHVLCAAGPMILLSSRKLRLEELASNRLKV